MQYLFTALGDFSWSGFLYRRRAWDKITYLFRWSYTLFACVVFFVVIALSALAGLFLLIGLLIKFIELWI